MDRYKTIKEKAIEWNISPRYVQYLCKNKKIEGVIKRGNVWFIPDGAPIPLKNTKKHADEISFIGTKKQIFDNAIDLFAAKGIDAVSIQDIAQATGIRQSTIYNHFKSKQDILNAIYKYYCDCFRRDRPRLENLDPIIRNGSFLDIIQSTRYEFASERLPQIAKLNKIIYQRVPVDENASKVVSSLVIEEGRQFVEAVLERAAELGRFGQLDIPVIAELVNSMAIYALFNWLVDQSPENAKKVNEKDKSLFKYMAELIETSMSGEIDKL